MATISPGGTPRYRRPEEIERRGGPPSRKAAKRGKDCSHSSRAKENRAPSAPSHSLRAFAREGSESPPCLSGGFAAWRLFRSSDDLSSVEFAERVGEFSGHFFEAGLDHRVARRHHSLGTRSRHWQALGRRVHRFCPCGGLPSHCVMDQRGAGCRPRDLSTGRISAYCQRAALRFRPTNDRRRLGTATALAPAYSANAKPRPCVFERVGALTAKSPKRPAWS